MALILVMMSSSNLASQSAAAAEKTTQNADGRLTQEEAKKLKSPVPFNKDSIVRGRNLFIRDCKECHGADGKGFAALKTPDFTDPKWQRSLKDKDIIETIKNGKKGTPMPPFADKLKEDEIQELVNYIRSLNSEKKK